MLRASGPLTNPIVPRLTMTAIAHANAAHPTRNAQLVVTVCRYRIRAASWIDLILFVPASRRPGSVSSGVLRRDQLRQQLETRRCEHRDRHRSGSRRANAGPWARGARHAPMEAPDAPRDRGRRGRPLGSIDPRPHHQVGVCHLGRRRHHRPRRGTNRQHRWWLRYVDAARDRDDLPAGRRCMAGVATHRTRDR